MRYQVHVACPICDKQSIVTSEDQKPRVNCGDCLMDRVEIVTMTIIKVEEVK